MLPQTLTLLPLASAVRIARRSRRCPLRGSIGNVLICIIYLYVVVVILVVTVPLCFCPERKDVPLHRFRRVIAELDVVLARYALDISTSGSRIVLGQWNGSVRR